MENNTKKYEEFRNQYPEFIYHSYEITDGKDSLTVTYHFEIPGLARFAPVWTFPKPKTAKRREQESWGAGSDKELDRSGSGADPLLEKMIFSLGMTELVSYWKITCSPLVRVEAGGLTARQIDWWKDLYFNGLGEFFYVNGIREAEISGFMDIRTEDGSLPDILAEDGSMQSSAGTQAHRNPDSPAGVLVPIGGGKDSAVTLELLKEAGENIVGYIINPRGATLHTAEKAGLSKDRVICVRRTLDKNMLELNKQGFLNGHTPFSAIVAFSSLVAARLYGLSWIALSNESSANESTVLGSTVNHQYSKSFRFEKDFHDYAKEYLPGSAYYFSLLRPLSEFQIARYFAKCRQFHDIFRSCNAGSKEDKWCGHCPKCLFVCLILSPFLSREEVIAIFGRDMLDDPDMLEDFRKLTGMEKEKPFECVGSRDEVNAAVSLTIDKMEEEGQALPELFAYYKNSGLYRKEDPENRRFFTYFDGENLLPPSCLALIKEKCL